MKKKIAIVGNVSSSLLGFRKELLEKMVNEGYIVETFSCDLNSRYKKELENMGVTPRKYNLSRNGKNILTDLLTILELRRSFKKHRYDLILSYFSKPVIYSSLATSSIESYALIEGLGSAFTIEPGEQNDTLTKKILIFLFKIALPRNNKVIFLNEDDPIDLLVKYKIEVPYEVLGAIGLDLNKFPVKLKYNKKTLTFIFVGRLLKEKGILAYLSAAKTIKTKYGDKVRFIVAGTTDPENPSSISDAELNTAIKDNMVDYRGHVPNISALLLESDVFILPSYYREGVPRSTQEAMASGLAIITTDSTGCRDTVESGENGFLVKPHDGDGLINAIEVFIKQPNLVKKFGIASRKKAELEYDVKKKNETLFRMMGL
jgi:glycosyltransferase involved in cell wall biosynthesis